MRGLAVFAAALVLVASAAAAHWSANASGSAYARGGTLAGNKPTVTKSGAVTISVAVSWTATPGATGYVIRRTGGIGVLAGTCISTVTTTSCTDTPVVALQTYTYTVTPVAGGWTGTQSAGTTVST